ncbi:MAG: calcium-translocating P-type ATPase, PMCA-type [Clostridia bacterium]|nr:calcium-translocating P-type ATPase, PMCA-type [Clostridia bacterium]
MRGLSEKEVLASRKKHGENRLTQRRRRSFLRQFWANLGDPVIRILLCAMGVNLLLLWRGGDWIETVGIAVSVFLATFISTLSEYGSERAFSRLRDAGGAGQCRVRRAEGLLELPAEELVVGDIVCIGAGERVPADGRVFRGRVGVDQAAMTGENREIDKRPGRPGDGSPADGTMLLAGTVVLSGSAEFAVTAVGDATALGGISREVQAETRPSPLKLRLTQLAKTISRLGYGAAVLIALAYLINTFLLDSGFCGELIRLKLTDLPYLAEHLLHALTLALTVIVVAVPEGLPMMIAVVLSANIRRMVRDKVLVRKPTGIEAAGSMNLLFTDKTGTLTEGRLSVSALLTLAGEYRQLPAGALGEALSWQAACNSDAVWGARDLLGGNATDQALCRFVGRRGCRVSGSARAAIPFDSARKFSAAVVLRQGRAVTLIKGAPELLMPHLRWAMDGAGGRSPFSPAALEGQLRAAAGEGGRLLLLAECEGDQLSALRRGAWPEMTLQGVLLLRDRLRPEAKRAVRDLQGAGIGVVMITGDSPDTGRAIGEACGILGGARDLVLSGSELARMRDEELAAVLPRLGVVARALPSDKSRLVRVAQEAGLVVGMTGDGINDAPALRLADIGFALGSGTQVAREAGDILILDDNLASVVRAVLYGRNIFKSIRKFITLQLTMNFSAVGVSMLGPFFGIDAPVTVVQMLWVNLIMDTLGGLAFAGEAAQPSLMEEPPKRRDEPILCGYMANQIALLGGFTVALCMAFLKLPAVTAQFRAAPDNLCLLTAFFAFFIFAGICNCFNARTDRINLFAGLSQNRAFIGIMTAVAAVQLAFVYLGGAVLRTMPLTLRELGIALGLAALVIPADFVRKLIWRRMRGKRGY